MLNWIKRQLGVAPSRKQAAPAPRRRSAASRAPVPSGPVPLPEVVAEGNSQVDWSVWEDSVSTLDSQLGDLPRAERVYERESDSRFTRPSPLPEPDVFGKVTKNHD